MLGGSKIQIIMFKRKSIMSRAINAALTAFIRTIFGWVEEWGNDAFFFLVIGDKNCTDVAWYNPEQLSCDGALAISADPRSAAAFCDMNTGVELLMEDNLKENKFKEDFEKLQLPENYQNGWYSYEDICGGKKYTEQQAKKGGAQ